MVDELRLYSRTLTQSEIQTDMNTPIGGTANPAPTVTLTSPTNGASFTAPATVTLSANASDTNGTISKVEFYNGTTLLNTDTAAPYTYTWSSVAAGTYAVKAIAYDNNGASATSTTSTITVAAAANQPPTVSLTAPANGTSYTAPASISFAASASDPNGTISKVEFYNGTTLLNSDTTAPYSYSWTNVAAGTYGVRAVAYDNGGASASSATATITVGATSSNGLIGAYGLNEGAGSTVTSSYVSGPSGTVTNAIWTTGKYGKALSFAANGEVNFGDVDLTGSFTVMGWLQTRSLYTSSCGSFVMKAHDYGFEICNGQLLGEVGANGAWTGRVTKTLTSADLNVWKHLALTYDGTTVRMYVDGLLVNSSVGAHTTTSNPLLVGHWIGGNEYLDGMVDELRLYSRTLSQSEIQTNMNAPIGAGTTNQAPAVTLTSPASGATFTAPASVTLSATASDTDGTISKVEFYNGSTLLNSDTTSPYSYSWSNLAAGTYAVKAIAYDNNGASTSSATSTITVSALTSTIPTGVIFTASPDHATLVTYYELRIYAPGANPSTATPIAKSNLGKPTPAANNDITVNNLSTFFSALTVGNYVGAVAAVGSGGSSVSTGVTFTR
jgi:uncharacterized protein (DUF2141 family)